MNMRHALIAAALLLSVQTAMAQSGEAAVEKSRVSIDAALERAREQALEAKTRAGEREKQTAVQIENAKKQQSVDPAELASQYKEIVNAKRPAGNDLLVFVSTSIPISTLKKLGEQAQRAGGVIVFRGIKGGLSKNAMNKWMELIKPLAETGATIQIDPEAFGRHDVTAVPTFVITSRGTDGECGADQCQAQSSALAGDVTLEYALEKWSGAGGRVGVLADRYLARMEGKTR